MVKVMAVADLHNDFRRVRQLADKAKKESVNVVLVCGDITFFDEYVDGMIGPLMENNRRVLFVPGNHDSFSTSDFISEKYGIINLHGGYEIIDDIGFFGFGGANVGPNIVSENDAKKYMALGFKKIEKTKKKILVTHVHPRGKNIEKEFKFPGSKSVTDALYTFRPDIHIHGHIHEAEGSEEMIGNTKSICVGKKGRIFEI